MIPGVDLDLLKDKKRTKTCTCVGKNKRLSLFLISLKDKYFLHAVYKVCRNKVYGNNNTKTKRKNENNCKPVNVKYEVAYYLKAHHHKLRMYILKP